MVFALHIVWLCTAVRNRADIKRWWHIAHDVHASGCLLLHGTNIHNSPYKLQRWSGQYEAVMGEKKRSAFDTSKQFNAPFAARENEHTLEWIFTKPLYALTQQQLKPDTWRNVRKDSRKTCMSDIDVLDSEDSLLIKKCVTFTSRALTHKQAQTCTDPLSHAHTHWELCVELFYFGCGTPPSFLLPSHRVSCIFHALVVPVEGLCVHGGTPHCYKVRFYRNTVILG